MKRLFPWYDWSKFARARRRKKSLTRNHFVGFHKIILSRLPAFEEFNDKDYQALMRDVLNQAKTHARAKREHKKCLRKTEDSKSASAYKTKERKALKSPRMPYNLPYDSSAI
jgi:hypothetical protein